MAKNKNDIYTILKKDHAAVKRTFSKYKKNPEGKDYASLFTMMEIHMDNEEDFFYPTLQSNDDTKELILQAVEEHKLARQLIEEARLIGEGEKDSFMAKMTVLEEMFNHHAEEEEKSLFPKAKKIIEKEEEATIKALMEDEKWRIEIAE